MSATHGVGEGEAPATTRGLVAASVGSGVLVGLLLVVIATSFASLVFQGPLAGRVYAGIGIMLASVVVHATVIAFTSSVPGVVGMPQDSVLSILALLATSVVAGMPSGAGSGDVYSTVLGALVAASLVTGACMGLLGAFRLGGLIRFIPYPVIGGFLGGAGWLLLAGGINVLVGGGGSLRLLDLDFGARAGVWVPGIAFAVLAVVIGRRVRSPLALPGLIVAGLAAFFAVVLATGADFDGARERGWLLAPLEGRMLWVGIDVGSIAEADWGVVLAQWAPLLTVALVSAVAVLLTLTAMELETGRDIDLDAEMRGAGLGNLLSGMVGGVVGYHSVSLTALASSLGGRSRIVGLTVAGVAAGALFIDARPISLFPIWLVGGLLCYLGMRFLVEWLWDARKRLGVGDYLVVVLIVVTSGTFGYLQGIGLGIILAVVLFVLNYSRIDSVKHHLTGVDHRSNVDRAPTDREVLGAVGQQIHYLILQGFVFFGSANGILEIARRALTEPEEVRPRVLVVDFRQVSGMDSSAVMSLAKLARLAAAGGCALSFSSVAHDVLRRLEAEGGGLEAIPVHADLDHAAEWAEDQLLGEIGDGPSEHPGFERVLAASFSDPSHIGAFLDRLDRVAFGPGDVIVRQGDEADTVFFVESGRVSVFLALEDGSDLRLRAMGPGAIIGELALYLGGHRTATVVADEPTEAYMMSSAVLTEIEGDAPELAAEFHRFAARLSAERLLGANKAVRALLY